MRHKGRPRDSTLVILIIAAVVVVSASCDGNNIIGPENELEVINVTDTFEFQVTALNNVTDMLTYMWENTGTSANVLRSFYLTGGAVTIDIRDADGHPISHGSFITPGDSDLDVVGTFQTPSGTSGLWAIEVAFSRTSGDVRFALHKHEP